MQRDILGPISSVQITQVSSFSNVTDSTVLEQLVLGATNSQTIV